MNIFETKQKKEQQREKQRLSEKYNKNVKYYNFFIF